ncbi:hypothetical protein ACFOWX_04385 [Sphingorhabdus arenilitoris]|uniref:Uncharacterized protein n=1 Tax=Sphingorhabdus arenilitoris TaxID=1490041 RepID=A0ABV8RG24_9SPHN
MKLDEKRSDEMQKSLEHISDSLNEMMRPLIAALSQLNLNWEKIEFPKIEFPKIKLANSQNDILKEVDLEDKLCKRFEDAGWIAHYTSPWRIAEDASLEPDLLDRKTQDYYMNEWPEISEVFIDSVNKSDVDCEAKKTFAEAVAAHTHGLYRCAPRLLFPEIERVSRSEIHDGEQKPITSQKDLQSLIAELTHAEMAPFGVAAFRFYVKLVNHVYLQTDKMNNADDINAVFNDPVPNRHVALHGLSSYSTVQNSLNAIIFTDYIFQSISKIKQNQREIAEY